MLLIKIYFGEFRFYVSIIDLSVECVSGDARRLIKSNMVRDL